LPLSKLIYFLLKYVKKPFGAFFYAQKERQLVIFSAMIKCLCSSVLLLFVFVSVHAQNLSISGRVKDKKGETIPGAGVYLSNYKNATVTNTDGQFVLGNLKPGNYDVLVQMMGYLPYTKNVILSDKSATIEIVLQENSIALNEVVIRTDPNREKYLNMFKEFFIGKTPNSAKCKILNPAVLNIDFDNEAQTLTVKSSDFLIIENKALGYKLRYMLQLFEYNFKTRIVYFSGLPTFEDLKGSSGKKKAWRKNREVAYQGSSQQFFKTLYAGTSKENGFIINKLIKIPNEQRPADSVIDKNIKRYMTAQHGVVHIGSAENDALNYWIKVRQMPKEMSVLNRAEILLDTLVHPKYTGLKQINFTDELYVMYTNERETVNYTNMSGHSINRPLDIPNYQISIVHLLHAPVTFYPNGGIYEPRTMLFEGFWAYEKIADTVPMDYLPLSEK
jgi:hypothetical protein